MQNNLVGIDFTNELFLHRKTPVNTDERPEAAFFQKIPYASSGTKDSKAFEAKMMKQANDKKEESETSQLASEQGMEKKKQNSSPQSKSGGNSGKLLPNTASFEEILASIPNRKIVRNAGPKSISSVKGLPNTATLEEIKKTIPKN